MSTRARIAIPLANGRFRSIYSHAGGGPDGVGQTLCKHYNSTALATALVKLGGISRLRPRLAPAEGEVHSFAAPLPDVTVAYGRDRGDKDFAPLVSNNFTALVTHTAESWGEYLYVWLGDQWKYTTVPPLEVVPLPTESDLLEVQS